MKKVILFIFLLVYTIGRTQNEFPRGEKGMTFSSYNDDWKFFELSEPIEVKILIHLPSTGLCGNMAFASVSIVETKDKKIFRVLDLCNNSTFAKDQIVTILPAKKPDFGVLLPSRIYINPKTGEGEQYALDKKTLKTSYGNIK